jgi:hypothetical protein
MDFVGKTDSGIVFRYQGDKEPSPEVYGAICALVEEAAKQVILNAVSGEDSPSKRR